VCRHVVEHVPEIGVFLEALAAMARASGDPRVIIENLRDTTKKPEDEPELTLFDTFDGLDDMQSVEFYQHASNWSTE
jgi:hypothetical protein